MNRIVTLLKFISAVDRWNLCTYEINEEGEVVHILGGGCVGCTYELSPLNGDLDEYGIVREVEKGKR